MKRRKQSGSKGAAGYRLGWEVGRNATLPASWTAGNGFLMDCSRKRNREPLGCDASEGHTLRTVKKSCRMADDFRRQGERYPLVPGSWIRRQNVRLAQEISQPGTHLNRAQASCQRLRNAESERVHTLRPKISCGPEVDSVAGFHKSKGNY